MAGQSYNEIGTPENGMKKHKGLSPNALRQDLSLSICLPADLSTEINDEGGSAFSTQAGTRSDYTPPGL